MAMADRAGTEVTYLLTDVAGSTGLWEQVPTAMAEAMARHDEMVETAVARAGGQVLRARGEGDSRFAVFPRPLDALAAAADVVRALAAEAWLTPRPLAVRAAVHTGEASPGRGAHYGPAVNRAARVRAAAHPGQVLVSAAAAAAVDATAAGARGLSLRDLGPHRLGDAAEPERVYQLQGEGLKADFGPLGCRGRHNLPRAQDEFVGRELERAHLAKAIEGSRLVTVTGSGGTGKTRLALQVAAEAVDSYPDGVWWVELAEVAGAAMIPGALARALDVPLGDGRPHAKAVEDFLRAKAALVVLDNCEHLLPAAAAVVAPLMAAAPRLRVLATSRRPLGIAGERLWPLGPLDRPDPRRLPAPEELEAYDAVALFLTRARVARPGFALDAATAPTVADICARLDGIPLALELAAARLRTLALHELAAHLADRLALATDPAGAAAGDRHTSLRAALDGSWDLLAPPHQVALRRLAVFAGGFDLESAEGVAGGGPLDTADVLDALIELVDASLIVPDYDRARYRLLETVRAYAEEKLADAGEQESVCARHLAWFADVFEMNYLVGGRPSPPELAERFALELGNLRSALGWALSARHPDGLRLAGVLPFHWWARGHMADGMSTVAAHLDAFPDAPPLWRARAQAGLAFLHAVSGTGQGMPHREEALRLSGEHGFDEWWVSFSMGGMAHRDVDLALRGREQALSRGFVHSAAYACQQLGAVALKRDDLEEAARWIEEGVDLLRIPGVSPGRGRLLSSLATLSERLGRWDRAKQVWAEILVVAETLGDPIAEAVGRRGLGGFALEDGDLQAADGHFRRVVEIGRDAGLASLSANGLIHLSDLAIWHEDWGRARRYAEEAADEVRRPSHRFAGCALGYLAHAAILDCDPSAARTAADDALHVARAEGDAEHVARALAVLAMLELDDARYAEAVPRLTEALELFGEASKDHLDVGLRAAAMAALAGGNFADAARFLGAAAAARRPGRPPWDPPRRARVLADLTAALGSSRTGALHDEGAGWSGKEAIRRALAAVA